jgi:hypothetical protein
MKGNDGWRFYCTHCSEIQTWYSAFISISLLYPKSDVQSGELFAF